MKFAQVILDDVGRRCDQYLEGNKTMKFEHDFKGDLLRLMHEAEHGEPFAFVRFCDGEHAIMENQDIPTADGWKVGNEWMRKAMQQAALATLPRYYKGIACPCCWPEGAKWYRRVLEQAQVEGDVRGRDHEACATYSNLFVNGNYDVALPWLRKLAHNWCVVSSAWGSDIRVPAQWSSIRELDVYVPKTVDKMIQVHRPILMAAGPLGKVLIHNYWKRTVYLGMTPPAYTVPAILDIGSALDPDLFGGQTRGYHDPNHPNRKKVCVWET